MSETPEPRRTSRRSNIRRGCLVVITALGALVLTGCPTVPSSSTTTTLPSATTGPSTVGSLALGVNLAAWDDLYAGADATSINALFQGAGLRLMRYPGGSFADQFDWRTHTDSAKCKPGQTTSCVRNDPLGYDSFATLTQAAGGSMFVTVNYGSGTPTEAAGWVAHAKTSPAPVALWEVGNESYSCYETNQHLSGSPTYVSGYTANGRVCPATNVMARSYAVNALPYLQAMKGADLNARIGVPWAFSGSVANGAGVSDADVWNTDVLHALRSNVSFVDAHWYPFNQSSGISTQQILASVRRIPSAADTIRSTLHRYAPGATFVVGETNISERPTTYDFLPVSALFAAATSLEWLSAGAESVDWWDLNNFGTRTGGDFGLVSSGGNEQGAATSPYPPYYGYLLASMLTTAGSHLRAIAVAPSSVLGFESDLQGRRTILLVNSAPDPRSVTAPGWFKPGLQVQTETYTAATATNPEPITGSTLPSAATVTLPAESVVVLVGTPG